MYNLDLMLNRICRITAAVCVAVSIISCDGNSGQKKERPTVGLEAGEATENSVSFRITPTGADEVRYMVITGNGQELTAGEIFGKGITADAAEAMTYTAENLEPNTSYDIFAAAENAAGYSEAAKLTMKTAARIPTVSLSARESGVSSLTFTITTSDSGKAAYICIKSGEAIPEAAEILSSGKEVTTGGSVSCTVSDLDGNTGYTIIAAASDVNGENPVASEPLSMQTTAATPRIGDFYYSDGTWSTALNSSKTPIGIVFYTNVASDYKDRVSMYKLKDRKTPMGAIRGYVIALQDATFVDGENEGVWWSFFESRYGGSCSSETDDFLGYSNTMSIIAEAEKRGGLTGEQSSFPAAYYATEVYEKTCPAPESSSGWFLPSAYQFKYIYDKVYFNENGTMSVWLEKSFETLGDKASPLYASGSEYWTSTEKYDSNGFSTWAYYFCFDSSSFKPGFISDFRKNGDNRIRSVLVF